MTNLVVSAWSPKKHRGHVYALVACWTLFASWAIAQSGQTYKVRLSTVPVDATMLATVTGSGSAKAVLKGNTLMISGTFQGLRSPATRAAIHAGPQKGIRGPAIHDVTVSKEKAGTLSGSVELSASEVEALKNGCLYLQIDSERAPDGNLWGWLLR
ncbi:MAG TPA: CHRD domain-containing protein [Candidatus Acidoferrales bacterium]|nr:CHRD domain-containing protein [Candidatus Acidoferrales bacterium]